MKLREQIATWLTSILGPWLERIAEYLRPVSAELRTRYRGLERREQVLVQIGGAMLTLFLFYNLVYTPIRNLREGTEAQIAFQQRQLAEVRRLTATYVRLKADLASAETRAVPPGKDFSLFSVLQATLSRSLGREKIGSITPADKRVSGDFVEYGVNLTLTDVSLAQLVDTLYQVKTLPAPVTVSSLNIKKRSQNPHSFDVEMTCHALAKND